MSLIKSFRGEATNGVISESIPSIWSYSLEDPWVVRVNFPEQEVTWDFYLDLMFEAFTSPFGQLHGSGDLQIEIQGEHAFFHLSNEHSYATLRFFSEDIRSFLDQVDDQGLDEVVSAELDEFLETL